MPRINYTDNSKKELAEIRKYITAELKNPIAAKNVLNGIKRLITAIGQTPTIGTPLAAAIGKDILSDNAISSMKNYRRAISGNYLIFYHYDETEVVIDDVIYGGRDLQTLFMDIEHEG